MVKIQEFTLFVFSLEIVNLGLKMKILKFLGMELIYGSSAQLGKKLLTYISLMTVINLNIGH